jgi:integrase
MNSQPNPTSATEPRPEANLSNDDKFKITHWLGLYEGFLHLNYPRSYERYSRVLTRFYTHFPGKQRTFDFLRPDFETYKQGRLKEGASRTTVNIELSVLRGFWSWMLRMEAPGVMINPVRGVRVKRPSKNRNLFERPLADRNGENESPA